MGSSVERRAASLRRPEGRGLWVAAVLLFGVGDAVTTGAGLGVGAAEANPLPELLLQRHGLPAVVALKAVTLAVCRALWWVVPWPHRIGIPLALSLLGAVVNVWNLLIVAAVLLG